MEGYVKSLHPSTSWWNERERFKHQWGLKSKLSRCCRYSGAVNQTSLCCVNHGLCLVSSFYRNFSPSKVHLQQRQGHSVGCRFRGRKQPLTLFYCCAISAAKCEENMVQLNQNCSTHTNHKYLMTKYPFHWSGMKPDPGWPQIRFVHLMCYSRGVQLKAEGNKLRCCGSNPHRGAGNKPPLWRNKTELISTRFITVAVSFP